MAQNEESVSKKRKAPEADEGDKATKKAKKGEKPKKGARPKKRKRKAEGGELEVEGANKKASHKVNKRNKQPKAERPKKAKAPKKPREPLTVARVVGRVLPVICLALAFVAIVILYRKLMPQTLDSANTQAPAAPSEQVLASSSNPDNYAGLEDKWLASGLFTTGNKELDMQVKEFCDALTVEGSSARENANNVYNTIVWSQFEERQANELPSGTEWTIASARHYFAGGNPSEGQGGSGDVYDFAATIGFCMRYFGFYDALAVPIVKGTLATGQSGSALVLVSDENGMPCVCDPTLAAEGFMIDRGLYTIVVENIGQDLTSVEALGLEVQQPQGEGASSNADVGASASTDTNTNTNTNTGNSSSAGMSSGSDIATNMNSGTSSYEDSATQYDYGQTYN